MPETYVLPGSARRLDLHKLEPGDYSVTVEAYTEDAGYGAASASVEFNVPTSAGLGAAGTSFVVRAQTLGGAAGASPEAVIAGLAAGNYEVRVQALNAEGWGPLSSADALTVPAWSEPGSGYRLADVTLMEPTLAPATLPGGAPPLARSIRIMTRTTEIGEARGSLRVALVSSAHPLAPFFVADRVLRLRWDNDSGVVAHRKYEHWRIESVESVESGGDSFVATCRPLARDLDDTVAAYRFEDGSVSHYVTVYDMTVAEALDAILTSTGVPGRRVTGEAVTFVPVHTPSALTSQRVTFSAEGATHLRLLQMLAEQAGGRVSFRSTATEVHVSIEPFPDLLDPEQAAATIDARHTFSLRRSVDAGDLVTALVPLGGEEGSAFNVGRLQWEVVGVITGERIVLAAPGVTRADRYTPVWSDGALVGTHLVDDDGVAYEVVGSVSPNVVVLASGAGFAPSDLGMLLRFAADAEGAHLTTLEVPGLGAHAPANERVRRYTEAISVPNLIETGGASADFSNMTGWSPLAQIYTSYVSDPFNARHGERALRVRCTVVGAGIQTAFFPLSAHGPPYASAWLALTREAGKWLVEMVDASGQVFGPRDNDDEDGWINADQREYGIHGMEVRPSFAGAGEQGRRVRLRITCVELPSEAEGGGAASIILDAATLTQSAAEYPYAPGLGPHAIWRSAAAELARLTRAPRAAYSGSVVDPLVLAALPPLSVEDVVAVNVTGSTALLPVVRIDDELNVGDRLHIRTVALGQPDLDAYTTLAPSLGVTAPPGRVGWHHALGVPSGPAMAPAQPRLSPVRSGGDGAAFDLSRDINRPETNRTIRNVLSAHGAESYRVDIEAANDDGDDLVFVVSFDGRVSPLANDVQAAVQEAYGAEIVAVTEDGDDLVFTVDLLGEVTRARSRLTTVEAALPTKAGINELASLAFSGRWQDVSEKPVLADEGTVTQLQAVQSQHDQRITAAQNAATARYLKPTTGIPQADLSPTVQDTLDRSLTRDAVGQVEDLVLPVSAVVDADTRAIIWSHPTYGNVAVIKGYAPASLERTLRLLGGEYVEIVGDYGIRLVTQEDNIPVTINGRDVLVNDLLSQFPTSDPAVAGRIWRDGTDIKVSLG